MTRLVKILQVESVVPNLIDRGPIERLLANFEFNGEDHWSDHENDINASAHSRYVELEEDRSCEAIHLGLKKVDLYEPSSGLSSIDIERRIECKLTDNFLGVGFKEVGNRRAVPKPQ